VEPGATTLRTEHVDQDAYRTIGRWQAALRWLRDDRLSPEDFTDRVRRLPLVNGLELEWNPTLALAISELADPDAWVFDESSPGR
jgi:hypothetical protein